MQLDTPQASPLQSAQDDLTLVDALLFVRRRWVVILTPALMAAVSVAVIFSARTPVYQSTATLDLPTEVKPELRRVLSSPQAFQLILESPATKNELTRRLEAKHLVSGDVKYVLRSRLSAATLPFLLEATVESPTPGSSASIVEEWVGLFQERIGQMGAEAEEKAEELRARKMTKLREHQTAIESDFVREFDDIVQRFEKKCIERRQQTQDLLLAEDIAANSEVTAYETETEKLLREPDFKNSLAALNMLIDALQRTYGALQDEQAKLTFQIPQPEGAAARTQQLAQAIDTCAEKLQPLTLKLQETQAKRDVLERNRNEGLLKLKHERTARKAKLRDQRYVQLASLEQQRELEKSLSQSKNNRMAYVHASMAAIQKEIEDLAMEPATDLKPDVRMQAAPVAPAQLPPPSLVKYTLLGLFGGLILGVVLAIVLEAAVRAFRKDKVATECKGDSYAK